jgi:hypothetical protein
MKVNPSTGSTHNERVDPGAGDPRAEEQGWEMRALPRRLRRTSGI